MIADDSHGQGEDGRSVSWSPNLLTRIATTIGSRQRENVATTALLYVMQANLEAGRAVVAELAQRAGLTLGGDLPSDLVFVGQDFGADGRPDLVGRDGRNRPRVVIEAKIEAVLQPEQIARYSKRLDPEVPCVVVVLAPERRLPRLVREASGQLADIGQILAERDPTTWQSANRALTLLGISWVMTLDVMQNVTSSADLIQLRGFYDYLEKATFLPLSSADIAAVNGRLLWSITSVAQNIAAGFDVGGRHVH